MQTLSGLQLGVDFVPSRPRSPPTLHLFIHSFVHSAHSLMCTVCHIQAKGKETHCMSASGSQQFVRAGAQQRTSAQDVPRTGGSALLEILTEPWLGDDFSGPAVGKLPAWRGCTAKAFLIPPAQWE